MNLSYYEHRTVNRIYFYVLVLNQDMFLGRVFLVSYFLASSWTSRLQGFEVTMHFKAKIIDFYTFPAAFLNKTCILIPKLCETLSGSQFL